MFDPELIQKAEAFLQSCRAKGVKIATAESCTGGLIAAVLTAIPGSSDVVDRGFITYSNAAKVNLLGVSPKDIDNLGAVSSSVAEQMASGCLARSNAQLAVAVTGVAGPGGGTDEKPVGLVYIATATSEEVIVEQHEFGDETRDTIRRLTVIAALSQMKIRL
ncbi:MAG: CinA family protein [Pseudomonadota bacterium]